MRMRVRLLLAPLALEIATYLPRFLEWVLPFATEAMFFNSNYITAVDNGLRLRHGLPHPGNLSFFMPMRCVVEALVSGWGPSALLLSAAALWLAGIAAV